MSTNVIKFEDYRERIKEALVAKKDILEIQETVSLVDGFISQPISIQLSNSIVIGGQTVPMIMLLGNKTGKIYLFALKALLPELEAKI